MKNKLTKSATLIIMFMVMLQSVYAQDYLITFSGSGQSTTVETIEVKNIAQQTTLTLSGADTLLLTDVVGTGDMPALSQGVIVYPNPANHSSRLEFYNSSAGNTRVEIYDFSGRLIIHKSIPLVDGSHAFTISSLKAGIYLVKVNTPEHTYSQRLVSTSVQGLTPELQNEGISQSRPQAPGLKSISNIVAMQYNDGERLVFKAISGDYAHTKSLVPTESQNMDFEFMGCVDGDGNHYGLVTIGEQVWMAENLKTTHYRNGTPIEYPGNNNSAWENNTTGAYAWYDNDISWKDSYGALYNWHAVNNANGLCPSGWYVPSDEELKILEGAVDSQYGVGHDEWNGTGWRGSDVGKKLKATTSWSGNGDETDDYGFGTLAAGRRGSNGGFHYLNLSGDWWSAAEYATENAWSRYLAHNHDASYRNINYKEYGFSVRCLME